MSGTRIDSMASAILQLENNGVFKLAAEYRDASVLHIDIRHQRRDAHSHSRDYFHLAPGFRTPSALGNLPFAFARMNTPTDDFSMPLDLQAVANRLEEVTPEAQFRNEATHSSKWFCSIEHSALTTKTITERRSTIKNSDYWKQEAIHYKTAFANVVFDILLEQCTTDSTTSSDSANRINWQKMTDLYKRRFARQGLDAEEFEKHRRSIETEEYWRHEAESFKSFAGVDEENLYARLRAPAANRRHKVNSPETKGLRPSQRTRRSRGGKRNNTKRRR
ncbi:hypothetical protein A9K55_005686 [Cordyceps militaris]|uniref:Uncharacterized protein n=1 Tax=Cordyceps militaris TaxID=73501 RepID=A0A2H4SDU1_CORMI|nr:hypothetical protein A9K55_005686 [Cordyceps militaris]